MRQQAAAIGQASLLAVDWCAVFGHVRPRASPPNQSGSPSVDGPHSRTPVRFLSWTRRTEVGATNSAYLRATPQPPRHTALCGLTLCPARAQDSSPSADGLLYESPSGIITVSIAPDVQRKMWDMLSPWEEGVEFLHFWRSLLRTAPQAMLANQICGLPT